MSHFIDFYTTTQTWMYWFNENFFFKKKTTEKKQESSICTYKQWMPGRKICFRRQFFSCSFYKNWIRSKGQKWLSSNFQLGLTHIEVDNWKNFFIVSFKMELEEVCLSECVCVCVCMYVCVPVCIWFKSWMKAYGIQRELSIQGEICAFHGWIK